MFICMSFTARLRRWFGAAVAVVGRPKFWLWPGGSAGRAFRRRVVLAVAGVAVGVIPGVVQASSAAAAPTPRPCTHPFASVNATIVFGDPVATYSLFGGYYRGAQGVAYKVTGQFPHSTTMSFTGYDDYGFIKSPASVLTDADVTADSGSVNPFQVGQLVNASRRNYTAWFWPDTVPVPTGLKNVVLFPATATAPNDKRIRIDVTMRQYQMQPGYRARQFLPTVQAVSTSDLKPVRCPASVGGRQSAVSGVTDFFAAARTFGLASPPQAQSGNRLYFLRVPYQLVPAPESYPSDGSIAYLIGSLDPSKLNVVTWHKTATYFNNQALAPDAVMGDYQARYMSMTLLTFPVTRNQSVNQDNAIYQPDGSWVTVVLPSQPSLTPEEAQAVRARAASLGYNVIQAPRGGFLPGGKLQLTIRQKVPNPSFCCSLLNVPSWTDPNNPATANNNYQDWAKQTSRAFFHTYASNRRNMKGYWVGGRSQTFEEFMHRGRSR
jgi:hypothetical protein